MAFCSTVTGGIAELSFMSLMFLNHNDVNDRFVAVS